MFRGLAWMHKNKIFHRDFKPQNILVNPDTLLLQIADFGSSVIIGEYDPMSSYNVTRYYRPPELLLGAHKYGPAIDVWSAGCVFAEMLRGRIFLPGQHTENQLEVSYFFILLINGALENSRMFWPTVCSTVTSYECAASKIA